MGDFDVSNSLLRKVLFFIKNSDEYEDPSDMLDLLHKSHSSLVNPNPLRRKAPNATDRQAIESGKVSWKQHTSIELNTDQKTAILALSDELELNEMDCLGLWVTVSDSDKRRSLESQLGRRYGSLEMNLPIAARELFYLQTDCELRVVTELLKARYDSSFIPDKKSIVMTETNRLLRDGKLGLNLIESLSSFVKNKGEILPRLVKQQGGRSTSSSVTDSSAGKSAWAMVHKRIFQLTECLFYAFYQTQIEINEADALLELIRQLSELVLGDVAADSISSDPSTRNGSSSASSLSQQSAVRPEWQAGLYQILVVLQLTHVCALDQIRTLYSRHVDAHPFCSPEVGNAIRPQPKTRDGMDKPWKNTMASGFACLVFAILREPYVDIRDPNFPASDVVWLVEQASQRQAYSYMRLCMLPVLQVIPNEGSALDLQSILMSVLCDLVHNLLTVFCLPVYDDYCAYGFPFPSSRMKLREDVRWAQEEDQLLLTSGEDVYYAADKSSTVVLSPSGSTNRLSTGQQLMRDCQDDMLYLITALISARPFFACPFWVPGKHHPYTSRALDGVGGDLSLIVPSLKFLAALASGPGGCTAEATYTFVKNKHPGRFDWEYFFLLLGRYVEQLSVGESTRPGRGPAGATNTPNQQYQGISDADSEVLESIVDLLGVVMRSPCVTESFYAMGFEPVQSLFALLACPVGLTLKGCILRCLASICRGTSAAMAAAATETSSGSAHEGLASFPSTSDPSAAAARVAVGAIVVEEIWSCFEHYRLLPITSAMTGGNKPANVFANSTPGVVPQGAGGARGGFVGLHYELEAVESSIGMYPVTDGFLSLLLALFQHEKGLPVNLGYGHRIPGVVCYIDYVVSEILMKMHRRQFSPELEGQGQRWKITSQAVMVLAAVMQHYTINAISVDDVTRYVTAATAYAASTPHKTSLTQSTQNPADRKRNVSDTFPTSRDAPTAATPTALFDTPSQLIDSMIADFRDETASYPLDIARGSGEPVGSIGGRNVVGVQRRIGVAGRPARGNGSEMFAVPRPKTAGFSTMCHILSHSRRLFDLLLSFLNENSPDALRLCREDEVARTCWRSTSIIRTVEGRRSLLTQLQLQQERERYEGTSGQYDSFRSENGRRVDGRDNRDGSVRIPREEIDEEDLDLPIFGWDEFLYDIPFWRHRTVAAVVGLLYEVSLREAAFMTLLRVAGPLSIVRSEKGGAGDAASLVPVQLTDLATTLTSSLSSISNIPPLCVVADYIAVLPEPSSCFPSVPVLAVRILQHVALTQSSHKVLSVIADSSSADSIVSACTRALADGNDGMVQRLAQHSTTIRRGGGLGDPAYAFGQIFTPSSSLTLEPLASACEYYFTNMSAVLTMGGPDSGDEGGLMGRVEDNIREAVMDLLLQTLMPNRMCLCHFLLGLLESVEAAQGGVGLLSRRESLSSFATRGFTMRPGFPANCLDAILDLLCPQTSGISLYHHHPIQANKCFELLYRLCAGPLTSEAAMQIIWRRRGARNVHFLQPHLHSFLDYHRLSDLLSSGEGGKSKRDGGELLQECARINCLAWALKILALELHRMELTPHVPRSVIQNLLSLLFDPDSSMSNEATSGRADQWGDDGSSAAQHTISGNPHSSILLLQLLNTLPLSTTFDSDGHDSTVVVQCMQQCSREHSAAQGVPGVKRRNEPPGRFTYVDVRGLAIMLQQIWGGSLHATSATGRHTAASGAFASQVDVDRAIDKALAVTVNYNKYNMLVAALANVCQGWRQVVDVSLLGCGSVMCGLQSVENDSSGVSKSERSILHLSDSSPQVAIAVNRIVSFLVLPTIHMLVSQSSMEMILAEQFARALLSMTAVLKDVCATVGASDFSGPKRTSGGPTLLLSEGQHDAMITGIVHAILRRGSSQSTRSSSSCVYRGMLYTCLVHLLRYGDSQHSSSGGDGCAMDWFNEHATHQDDDFNFRCASLLEPYAVDLVDIAGGDAAAADNDGAAAVSRMSAFSALGCILSILGPSGDGIEHWRDSSATGVSHSTSRRSRPTQSHHDPYYGSAAYIQCLHILRDRGHLERILLASGLSSVKSSGNKGTQTSVDLANHPADGIMEATLTLCAHLACSRDGTHILVDMGVLDCVNNLPPLQVPSVKHSDDYSSHGTPFSIATADAGEGGKSRHLSHLASNHPSTVTEVEIAITPLLRLLRAVASSSPSVLVLKQCALFMVRNHPVISFFLRLNRPSLKSLRIVHAIVGIMCVIAPASIPQQQFSETKFEPAYSTHSGRGVTSASLWEVEMGPRGDAFTADLCRLCRVFGAKPTRNWHYSSATASDPSLHYRNGSSSGTSWWAAVIPTSPFEEQLKECFLESPRCLSTLGGGNLETQQWSRFESLQLTLGLQILERIASFFRIRSNLWVSASSAAVGGRSLRSTMVSDSGRFDGHAWSEQDIVAGSDVTGMLAVDLEDLMYTFQSMANFYLRICDPSSREREQNEWLTDPHAVTSASFSSKTFGRASANHSIAAPGTSQSTSPPVSSAVDRELRRIVLHTVESLFSAVYDVLAASAPSERIARIADTTACLQVGEAFPPHSFVRQVARCLEEVASSHH